VNSTVSIVERGPSGEPEVSFGSSPATRLELRRETEELRRLMYVATTRARDRLYFAATSKDGRLRRAARSLASLMPDPLLDLFGRVSLTSTGSEVEWVSDRGPFAFRVCRAPDRPVEVPVPPPEPTAVEMLVVEPLAVPGLHIAAVTAAIEPSDTAVVSAGSAQPKLGAHDERLLGSIVHRLFQRRVDPSLADEALERHVIDVIGLEERVDIADGRDLAQAAIDLYRRLRAQPDLVALLNSGDCLYEVPFSHVPAGHSGSCLRGVIDCLVIDATRAATVVEFKTGQPRPEHQAQADLYASAMGSLHGFSHVKSKVFYA